MAGGLGAVVARSAPHALPHACPTPGRVCPRSRLASCITLTKEMDGITVIVPDTNQDLTNCKLPAHIRVGVGGFVRAPLRPAFASCS